MRRVVITGLGAVSALGVGVPALWEALAAGRSGVRPVTVCDTSLLTRPIAAEVPSFDPAAYITPDQQLLFDRFATFATVAANEAWKQAGLMLTDEERTRTGVVIGTGGGGVTRQDEAYRDLYDRKLSRSHPFTIPRVMNNAAASHISMQYRIQGPTLCISTACSSASHAIGEASEMIRAGRADIMVAGGSDAPITPGVVKAWEGMRVLAPGGDDPAAACRPFSLDRQGLVLGEGAGVVILEERERAIRRGAVIFAELAGYGATADAGHITAPGVDAPARAIRQALDQAGLLTTDIDYVNAHGTATRLNDSTETTVLKTVFGDHARRFAVSSTKSMHGHMMGASGAVELIATIMAIQKGLVPPTANYRQPDPECDLDYVPNRAREITVSAAISNSFAFGGLNAVLAVKRA
ncbi:MAG TPA: beta-ketoacyl-ACP synthase II [Vicinamibacterales bacterium]|jgi:nodulation protein E